jgi:hypothetical protein
MNLVASVRKSVLKCLPHDGSDRKVVAALSAMEPSQLLVLYINWSNRFIRPVRRQVMTSRAFDQNPIVNERSVAVAQIINDIEQGRDLTKYLSRRLKTGFELPRNPGKKNLNRLEHLDLLLNEWGIHHLHVSTIVESDGFVQRDDPLLFAIFTSQRAFLIDVMGHKDFANDRLIRMVLDTWPDEGLVSELKGVMGGKSTYTKEDRAMLRSAGISTFVQIDQRVFSPGTGISTAGTSMKATSLCGRIMRTLKRFEDQVKADPNRIVALIRQHGCRPSDTPDFEFAIFQSGFGVIETTSGAAIGLNV